jgi:O-antigen ligase
MSSGVFSSWPERRDVASLLAINLETHENRRRATTLALALIFLLISARWEYLGPDRELTLAQLQQIFSHPPAGHVLGFAGLAALAVFLWARRPFPPLSPAAQVLAVGVAWCGLSVLWSADPWLSGLRLVGLLAYVACAVGLAGNLSVAELRRVARDGSGTLVLMACFLEAVSAASSPQPIFPERLSGPFHPNTFGALCATWLLSLAPDWRWSGSSRAFSLLALLALLLSGSRASFVACALSLGIFLYFSSARRRWLGVALVLPAVLWPALKRPNLEILHLNGRVRIWEFLSDYVSKSPWLGYGYEGYWRPEMIDRVSRELRWPIPSAHSAPLEVLLASGVVGLGLVLAFVLVAAHAIFASESGEDRAYGLAILGLALSISVAESTFVKPYSFYGLLTTALLLSPRARPQPG